MRIIEGNIYRVRCSIGRQPQQSILVEANNVDDADTVCLQHYAQAAIEQGKEVRILSMDVVLEQEPADVDTSSGVDEGAVQ